MNYSRILSQEFNLNEVNVTNIINLINEGNTLPFIARYRKELTNSIDDQVLHELADRLNYLTNLAKRKEEVEKSITEQGKFTDELAKALEQATTLAEVEDIYRPFKQKKKTRASVAIAKGLQPLADIIYAQELTQGDIVEIVKPYTNDELTHEEALQGAMDIIAEIASDNADCRKWLRQYYFEKGFINTKISKGENAAVYEMYKDYTESVAKLPSHRILAINRGEAEECLKVSFTVDESEIQAFVTNFFARNDSIFKSYVTTAVLDGLDRLITPSIEREIRTTLTERASEQAIKMFKVNLVPLLMQPPLKNKVVLAVDPAYRTGCKIAVVDSQGNVLDSTVVYATPPQQRIDESIAKLTALINKYSVDVISIGNGTASKEAEIFVSELIKQQTRKVNYAVVNEAGASVYSASKLAAEEFPQFDVSIRSAISIARRLIDPLAELIKIDVKSIGVGQYQHDMPQARLTEVLEGVVVDCVNNVGVDVNTASVSLLKYVAGLNASIAKNIVEYRKTNKINSRNDLLKISKLGAKAFEQCAGFIRIIDGINVLDNTQVHPEAYVAADKLLKLFGYTYNDVKEHNISDLRRKVEGYGIDKVAAAIDVGVPTLTDIVDSLLKTGRDVREDLPMPILRSDLLDINNLKEGMELHGVVRNVIDFGAFIDIGVHQDGLVHISQISDDYIKHPSDVLSVGQQVVVRVLSVDTAKNKISLTLKTSEKPTGVKGIARTNNKPNSFSPPNQHKTNNAKSVSSEINKPKPTLSEEEQLALNLQQLAAKYSHKK